MKKAIMKKAWQIAKAAASRFGGSSREYLSGALRQAWAEERAMGYKYETEKPLFAKEEYRFDILSRVHRLVEDSKAELTAGADASEIVAVESVVSRLTISMDLDYQVTVITGTAFHVAADAIRDVMYHKNAYPRMGE